MIAYKLFKIKNNKLYPLYINADKEITIKDWHEAECGERLEDGKVKSKLGHLAFRPGWHLTEIPFADHIGKKTEIGLVQSDDTVWCECEVFDEIDYNPIARENGINKNGKLIQRNAMLKYIPENGYYWYQTNANAKVRWLIAGKIKINKILTNDEVKMLCASKGITAQMTYSEYNTLNF